MKKINIILAWILSLAILMTVSKALGIHDVTMWQYWVFEIPLAGILSGIASWKLAE